MNLTNEVQNLHNNYKNIKKAIIGRGGEISATAGLVEMPENIFNIPADVSIASYEDSSIAYKKTVPVNAEEYALVKSLGGMSYKALANNNICIGDKVYRLNDEKYYFIVLATLDIGEYYLSFERDLSGMFRMRLNGGALSNSIHIYNENMIFTVSENGTEVSLYIESDASSGGTEYLNGTLKNFMLCKADDTDTEYKQYQPPMLVSAKPTSLESRGIQMLPYPYAETTKTDQGLTFTDNGDGTITINGTFSSDYNDLYPIRFLFNTDLHFEEGKTYYIKNTSSNIVLSIRYKDTERNVILGCQSSIVWKSSYKLLSIGIGIGKHPPFFAGNTFNNVLVTPILSETPIPNDLTESIYFEDIKELPEAVQSLEGWGLGIDAKHNNHIVWRNGRIIYVRMLDELDLSDFEWRFLASNKYFVTYPSWSPETWENVDLPEYTTSQQGIAISAGYEVLPVVNITPLNGIDKSIGFVNPHGTYERMIVLRNNAYTSKALGTNAKELRASLKGEKLIYLLKTPIETDITHLFTDTNPFLKVQGGGTIIAHNEQEKSVPSTLKYITKTGA